MSDKVVSEWERPNGDKWRIVERGIYHYIQCWSRTYDEWRDSGSDRATSTICEAQVVSLANRVKELETENAELKDTAMGLGACCGSEECS